MNGDKLYIIKCTCGHYKKLDDELCPVCGADYSAGARFTVLKDQDLANQRWDVLKTEKAFNDYMNNIDKPATMKCPNCKFEMIISETKCPKCGIDVRFVPYNKKNKQSLTFGTMNSVFQVLVRVWFWGPLVVLLAALIAFLLLRIF